MDPPGIAPGSPVCGTGVFLLDDEPVLSPEVHASDLPARLVPKDLNPDQLGWNQSCCRYTRDTQLKFSGSRETRTHKSRSRPPVFKTGPSSSRMTSVVASCGSWNRTNGLLVQSQASLPTATIPHRLLSSGGRNRTYGLLVQSQASLPAATTPECGECHAGIEPA